MGLYAELAPHIDFKLLFASRSRGCGWWRGPKSCVAIDAGRVVGWRFNPQRVRGRMLTGMLKTADPSCWGLRRDTRS